MAQFKSDAAHLRRKGWTRTEIERTHKAIDEMLWIPLGVDEIAEMMSSEEISHVQNFASDCDALEYFVRSHLKAMEKRVPENHYPKYVIGYPCNQGGPHLFIGTSPFGSPFFGIYRTYKHPQARARAA